MGTINGFVASEKGSEETEECDGLGLMMQTNQNQNQSFPCKKMMMMVMPHHHHHDPPLLSTAGFGGEACWDSASGSGPLFYNTSNPVTCMSDIYVDVGSLVPKTLQQPYSDSLSFSSSGGMVNVNVRIPFTAAQMEELERQTMIYKYMMASVPVPPQLLVPISKNPSNLVHFHPNLKGSLELGVSSNSDPEPWRCKRTDGKKWRCSRDVAPDQKYCERHAHKSRPRSRKHVESNPNFTTMRSPKSHFFKNNSNQPTTPLSSTMVSTTAAATSHGQPRCLEWFMNGEIAPAAGSNQEWEQMMQFKAGLKSSTKCNTNVDVSKQQNENSLNFYREGLQAQRSYDQYGLLVNPKLTHLGEALNSNQTQQTRHFIDAWSTAERDSSIGEIGNRCSVSSNQKLPFSSLTLSMSGGSKTNGERENTQMGLGILGDSERENVGDLKSQWMNPLSGMGSPPGGPLAEALCLGIASSTRAAAASSHVCNSGTTSCRSSGGDVRQEFDLIN